MLVSIVVPVYNVENYVGRCLQSVAEQTYRDLECIIVDDCGSDSSMRKCEDFLSSYNGPVRFMTLHHSANQGLSVARNTGLDAARGTYVCFLDSDDYLPTDAIERMMRKVTVCPGLDLVQGATVSLPEREYYSVSHLTSVPPSDEEAGWMAKKFYSFQFPVNAWNKLVRRQLLLDNNLRFKPGLIHEDELWTFYLAAIVRSVAVVQEPTYIHICTENSIMSTATADRTAYHWSVILAEIVDNLPVYYPELATLKYFRIYLSQHLNTLNSARYRAICPAFIRALFKHGYPLLAGLLAGYHIAPGRFLKKCFRWLLLKRVYSIPFPE